MIPTEYQPLVDRLRRYLNDTAELNELLQAEESTDEYFYEMLEDTLFEIDETFEPTHIKFGSLNKVPWALLKQGATIQVLLGKGIGSARNSFTYNDSGNIQIKDIDQYGRYVNYYNILIAKYARAVATVKRNMNLDSCYGGASSEYYDIS